MTVRGDLAPTARLRWVERGDGVTAPTMPVLQQWWAEDVPGYMRASAAGEWRDVPVGVDAP